MLRKNIRRKIGKINGIKLLFIAGTLFLLGQISPAVLARTGKRPVIIVPAIVGSILENAETGENVWFRFLQTKNDGISLPVSSDLKANKDALVATDILRRVKLPGFLPDIPVYQDVLDELLTSGYTETDWQNPQPSDAVYVFAYDWRRDNVESAHKLIAQIETVKRKLNRPDLQFDIIAHSMGGLVARYAAMYGAADLPSGDAKPLVTWAGAAHINAVYLFGVPNRGAMTAFTTLLDGYRLGGGKILPTPIRFSIADTFTIPALYQLLPFAAENHFLDENLMPLEIDLYNADTWVKYDWGAIAGTRISRKKGEKNSSKNGSADNRQKLSEASNELEKTTFDQKYAFLKTVLGQAANFHRALIQPAANSRVAFYAFGSVCKATLDAVVVYQNSSGRWATIAKPKKLDGKANHNYSKDAVRAAMFRAGDGRVTQDSLSGDLLNSDNSPETSPLKKITVCEEHDRLLNNRKLLSNLVETLHRETDSDNKNVAYEKKIKKANREQSDLGCRLISVIKRC